MSTTVEESSDVQPDAEVGQEIAERIDSVLALKATQKKFTPDQRAVMQSMGWPIEDMTPGDVHHFLYFCAARGLDPFLREVMPLKTKDGVVPIIRIAGMRRIAEETGAYEGLTRHFEFQDAVGDWHEGWPSTTEKPVACRIGVYKRGWREPVEGSCRTDEAEVYEPVKQPDGRMEWVLTERWRDRLFTMLKTTAEADGLRRAFPEHLAGVYTPEEMSRVRREREEAYNARVAAEGRAARRDAMRAALGAVEVEPQPERHEVVEGVQEGVVVDHPEPRSVGETMSEVSRLIRGAHATQPELTPEPVVETAVEAPAAEPVFTPDPEDVEIAEQMLPAGAEVLPEYEDLPLSEEQRTQCLQAELAEQAVILGASPEFLAQRFMGLADGEPLAAWSSDLLLRVVTAWRKAVVTRLQKDGRYEEAQAYSEWGSKDVDRVEVLFGRKGQ